MRQCEPVTCCPVTNNDLWMSFHLLMPLRNTPVLCQCSGQWLYPVTWILNMLSFSIVAFPCWHYQLSSVGISSLQYTRNVHCHVMFLIHPKLSLIIHDFLIENDRRTSNTTHRQVFIHRPDWCAHTFHLPVFYITATTFPLVHTIFSLRLIAYSIYA